MRSATGKLWARGRVGGLPWKLRPRAGLFQNMQRAEAEAAAWASSEDSRALSAFNWSPRGAGELEDSFPEEEVP